LEQRVVAAVAGDIHPLGPKELGRGLRATAGYGQTQDNGAPSAHQIRTPQNG
jgi:hypothetical protein